MEKEQLYRSIPKVDIMLEQEEIQQLEKQYGRDCVKQVIQDELGQLRVMIKADSDETEVLHRIQQLPERTKRSLENLHTPNMQSVVNGTGTILHTNLGRAPINKEHAKRLAEIAAEYSNLEYDLQQGRRGERNAHFESLLCRLTGAESALVVNNNAAAVLLILSSIAKAGEVIVSRGELVEIGGKFRIPDVMEQSGAVLVEVGTTNKTHLSDYKEALTEETKAILKVHTSNYQIVGFTESVEVPDLKPLAEKYGVPIIEDLGSGALVDLSKYGVSYEPTVQDAIRSGADVVCFSGDKMLGGPQAGIIVGKKCYIDKMKKSPLTRALRVDKFTVTALELTLEEYLSEERAMQRIPILKMIHETAQEVGLRAQELKCRLEQLEIPVQSIIEPCESQIGGGALPMEKIPSVAVTIHSDIYSASELERAMRTLSTPIIGRMINGAWGVDMRTIDRHWVSYIAESIEKILNDKLQSEVIAKEEKKEKGKKQE